jgi:hypothetical protein
VKALSIRQPWAWAILFAGKNIENRVWRTNFRGRILVHASKGLTDKEFGNASAFIFDRFKIQLPDPDSLPRGAIVGARSEWFVGPHGFVLTDPKAIERPVLCRGQQGIFVVPNDVAASVREAAAA